mgnify:CR=1 FL=1
MSTSSIVVYRARRILTMNPARPEATHVAVREGRILGVGPLEELAGWGAHTLDETFADKVLMPGLVEGHSHASEGTFWRYLYLGRFDRMDPDGKVDHHHDVMIQIGAPGNPPGFDDHLAGTTAGDDKTFTIHFPESYPSADLAGTDQHYSITVKGVRRRVLPELDDEFAKDVGEFASLQAQIGRAHV